MCTIKYDHHNAKGLSLSDENLLRSSQLLSWTLVDSHEGCFENIIMIIF